MKKRALTLVLALVLCLGLLPAGAAAANGEFVILDGVLKTYNGPGGHVTIPSTVTEIGPSAFYSTTYMGNTVTGVTIPDSVTTIRSGAFQSLPELTEVIIPDSVTWLEYYAFQGCPSLERVRLPQHLDYLGSYAFADCTALTDVTLPQTVDMMEGNVFDGTPWIRTQGEFPVLDGILYDYNGTGSSVVVPSGVKRIACCFEESFAEHSNITSITIPEGVTEISASAFMSCVSLREIRLPSTLKKLGSSAFWGCTSLESVVIPEGITVLEDQMFWGCTALKDVTLPASLTSIDSLCFVSDCRHGNGMVGIPLTGITIHGAEGSAAQRYAQAAGYTFVADQPTAGLPATEGIAVPATQTVKVLSTYYDEALEVDVTTSKDVTFYCYALEDPVTGYLTNYVKLRDVAQALNGTLRYFNVGWDGSAGVITFIDGEEYQPNGSEMIQNFTGEQPYTLGESTVKMYGEPVILDSIVLTDQNGGGYTYVKLRDIGRVINFNVAWQDGIVIDTWNTYTDAD